MASTGTDQERRLRTVVPPEEHAERLARGELFARSGYLVQPDRRLSQLAHARPPGVTTHQWNSAIRTHFHFVVCDRRSGLPRLGVRFDDPRQYAGDAERTIRMTHTVCAAIGLPVARIESPTLHPGAQGRRIVEYLLDARAFRDAASAGTATGPGGPTGGYGGDGFGEGGFDDDAEPPLSYRDIVGRLPDGRSGFVNDLGAVARSAAVEAYVARRLCDPIVRSLHVEWSGGVAEGWAWLDVRDGWCLFERVRLWLRDFSCGVAPGRLAEDLAVVAIGERLKTLETTEPTLHDKARLGDALHQIQARRDEMRTPFAFDHVCFD